MSRYDADDVYCIPGTAVLKNKAGITDQDQLDEYEGDFTCKLQKKNGLPAFAFRKHPDLEPAIHGLKAIKTSRHV